MSAIDTLPKLAAMFLTKGHRIPVELLDSPALVAPSGAAANPPAAPHPLDEWECPLDGERRFGLSTGIGALRMRPPEY